MRLDKLIAPIVVSLALASCGPRPDPAICSTPPAISTETPGPMPWPNARGCVHRWAYRLAGSADPSDRVAEAAMGGCRDAIDKIVVEHLAEGGTLPAREPLTGRIVDERAAVFQELRTLALFHVLQARAGHCSVP